MSQEKANQLIAEAKKIARQADSWVALSNALCNPNGGLIARYFPDAEQRQAFVRSVDYEQLNKLLLRMIKRRGLSPRPAGGKSASTQ